MANGKEILSRLQEEKGKSMNLGALGLILGFAYPYMPNVDEFMADRQAWKKAMAQAKAAEKKRTIRKKKKRRM